jgi:hypothetical protein
MRQVIDRVLRKASYRVVDELRHSGPAPRYDFIKPWVFDAPAMGGIKAWIRQN